MISTPPKNRISILIFTTILALLAASSSVGIFSPELGLVGIITSLGLITALICTYFLQIFIFSFLVLKPIIDLSWRWYFLEIASQKINLQTLASLLVICVICFMLLLHRDWIVPDVKGFLLLATATFSVLITPTFVGFNELIRLYSSVSFLFIGGIFLNQETSFKKFAAYFIASVAIPVFLSFLQVAGILPFEYYDTVGGNLVGRASGTYLHPLGLIYLLVYAIPLSLYLLSHSKFLGPACVALQAFIFLALVSSVATYHRAGMIAIGMEVLLWMVLTRKYIYLIVSIIFGLAAIFWVGENILLFYKDLVDVLRGEVIFSSFEFMRGRGVNWYLFLSSLFNSHPLFWLFGRGGSVAEGWVPYYGYWESDEPHNDFIRILYAYGLIGLFIYLSILFSFLRKSLSLHTDTKSNVSTRRLGTVMVVIIAAITILSITTEPMRYPTASLYFFSLGSVVNLKYRQILQRSEK